MYQNPKSATTAGLLGIFLGSVGAHNWYLGEKNKGIAHVCMISGGVLVEIIAVAVLPNVLSWSALLTWASILTILSGIAGLAISASGIWGLVEGIIILSQGDAGLARKGYAVANPMPAQNYGQPMGGYNQAMNNGYGQPMNNGYGQPMNNGYGQPMNNGYGQQPMPNNSNGAPNTQNNMPDMNQGINQNQPQDFNNNMNGDHNGQQ